MGRNNGDGPRAFWVWIATVGIVVTTALVSAGGASSPVPASLRLESFDLDFDWRDSVASTHIRMVVENPYSSDAEGRLQLPLSERAVLSSITLETPEGILVGLVTERAEAAQSYQEAQQAGESAALLESAGKGLLSLRLNVAAQSQAQLDVEYVEVIPLDLGVREYRFPLSALKPWYQSIPVFRLNGAIDMQHAWSDLESHGFPIAPIESADGSASWVHSAPNFSPAKDIVVSLKPVHSGYQSSLVVAAEEGDGAFVATLMPPSFGSDPLPLEVVFVLDRSGSMDGHKIIQARDALAAILGQLRSADEFGVVVFDDRIDVYEPELLPATSGNVADAADWVLGINARGSTNLEGGTAQGLAILGDDDRDGVLPMVVLITDGLANVGIMGSGPVIDSLASKNERDARIHVVGIGFDQDNLFLGELAASTRGFYRAVDPQDDVQADLEHFFAEIARPVLMDVEVEFLDWPTGEMHPDPLPDIYAGSQLVLAGRADLGTIPDPLRIKVAGESVHGPVAFLLELEASDVDVRPEAQRLWARMAALELERRIELGDDVADNRQALLALGLEEQIETTRTSWVLVPELGSDEPPASPVPAESHSSGGGMGGTGGTSGYGGTAGTGGHAGTYGTSGTAGHAPSNTMNDIPDDGASGGGAGPGTSSAKQPGPAVLAVLLVVGLAALVMRQRRRDA